jgi:hypothetical protein
MTNRFKAGDLVRVARGFSRDAAEGLTSDLLRRAGTPEGLFEVVRCLPELAGGEIQYRLRSCSTAQERVVSENQIVPASR